MDFRLELVGVPVSHVGRAKAFYAEKAGFVLDHDHTVSDEIRFVQLTPRGSARARSRWARAPDDHGAGLAAVAAWGSFVYFSDPDGNGWAQQQLPDWAAGAGGSGEQPDDVARG